MRQCETLLLYPNILSHYTPLKLSRIPPSVMKVHFLSKKYFFMKTCPMSHMYMLNLVKLSSCVQSFAFIILLTDLQMNFFLHTPEICFSEPQLFI